MSSKEIHDSRSKDVREQFNDIQQMLLGQGAVEKHMNASNSKLLSSKGSKSGMNRQAADTDGAKNTFANTNALSSNLMNYSDNKGNDIKFAVGLSENLMNECRRLNAENHEYRSQLNSLMGTVDELKAHVLSLQSSRDGHMKNEKILEEKNWELEASLNMKTEQIEKLDINNGKLSQDLKRKFIELKEIQESHETLVLQTKNLSKSSVAQGNASQRSIAELKKRIEELNDENDKLHCQLEELNGRESANEHQEFHGNLPKGVSGAATNEIIFEDSLLKEEASPRIGDERDIIEAGNSLDDRSDQNSKIDLSFKENGPISTSSPSKRTSRLLTINDSNDFADEKSWGDFIDTRKENIQHVVPEHGINPSLNTSFSHAEHHMLKDNTDMDSSVLSCDVDELKSEAQNNSLLAYKNGSEKDINKYDAIGREDTNSSYSKEQKFVVSKAEYNEYKQALPILNKLKSKELVTIPSDELEEMRKRNDDSVRPDSNSLMEFASSSGLYLIEQSELKNLKDISNLHSNPTIEYLRSACQKLSFIVLKQEEFDKLKLLEIELEKPTRKYLTEKANDMKLMLLDYDVFQRLTNLEKNPPFDYIEKKAESMGFVVINRPHYESLQRPSLDKLKSNAAELGYCIISEHEKGELMNPSVKTLEELAGSNNMVLVESHLYDNNLRNLESPEENWIRLKAEELGYVLIEDKVLQALKDDCSILRNQIESPSMSYLEEKALVSDYSFVRKDELKELKSLKMNPPVQFLKERAENIGKALINKEHLLQLEARSKIVSVDEISEAAAVHGKHIIDVQELSASKDPLTSELITQLESRGYKTIPNSYSTSDLEQLAADIGISILSTRTINKSKSSSQITDPESQTEVSGENVLQSENAIISANRNQGEKGDSSVDAEQRAFENAAIQMKRAETPTKVEAVQSANSSSVPRPGNLNETNMREIASESELKSLANSLGYSLLKKDDEIMKLKSALNNETLTPFASRLDLKLISLQEFNNLKSSFERPSLKYLREKASAMDYRLFSDSELATLKNDVENPTIEYLRDKLEAESYVCLKMDELRDLKSTAKPDENEIKKIACELGYEIIPKNEFILMKEAFEFLNLSYLKQKASEKGYIILEEEEGNKLREAVSSPSYDNAVEIISKAGERVISIAEYEQIHAKLASIDDPSFSFASSLAEKLHMKLISSDDHRNFQLCKELKEVDTMEFSESRKKNANILFNSEAEADDASRSVSAISSAIVENVVQANSSAECDITITPEDSSLQKDLPNTVLDNETSHSNDLETSHSNDLETSHSNDLETSRVYQRASKPAIRELESLNESSNSYYTTRSSMISSSDGDFYSAKSEQETIRSVSEVDSKSGSEDTFRPSKSKIEELAKTIDCMIISSDEMLKLKQQLVDSELELSRLKDFKDISKEDCLKRVLQDDEYVLIKKEEYQALRMDEVSRSVNITADEKDNTSDSCSKESSSPERTEKEMIEEYSKKHDILCIPRKSYVATTISKEPDVNNVIIIPKTYYNKLVKNESRNIDKLSDDALIGALVDRGLKPEQVTMPATTESVESFGIRSTGKIKKSQFQSEIVGQSLLNHTRMDSVPHSLTSHALSLATNASLTDKAMIPAITQVVIGEYLFKYHHRLLSLSTLSTNRHERYFWVHPYSLTLYWSVSSPVLANPADYKTKGVAIIGVESVEDNNPLPTGLYHKSIIVHSQNKSVKFTCTNRQRHNIWYNALRYMINRSLDDLNFEMDSYASQQVGKNELLYEIGERNASPRIRSSSSGMSILKSGSIRKKLNSSNSRAYSK